MVIRMLGVDDARGFWNLRLQAVRDEPRSFGAAYEEEVHIPIETIIQRLQEQWNSEENYVLGAFQADRIVGMVGFAREYRQKLRHKGNIWGMYVAPEQRGKGVGKLLLNQVIEKSMKLEGLEQLLLTVESSNTPAKTLYKSLGFSSYGLEKRGLKVGEDYFDEEHMILMLGQ